MNQQLESYLKELKRRLRFLPADQRDNEIQETRQHLLQLVEDAQTRGMSEAAARAVALRQFGTPDQVARGLRKAFRRQFGWSLWVSLPIAAVCQLVGSLFSIILLSTVTNIIVGPSHKPSDIHNWMARGPSAARDSLSSVYGHDSSRHRFFRRLGSGDTFAPQVGVGHSFALCRCGVHAGWAELVFQSPDGKSYWAEAITARSPCRRSSGVVGCDMASEKGCS